MELKLIEAEIVRAVQSYLARKMTSSDRQLTADDLKVTFNWKTHTAAVEVQLVPVVTDVVATGILSAVHRNEFWFCRYCRQRRHGTQPWLCPARFDTDKGNCDIDPLDTGP